MDWKDWAAFPDYIGAADRSKVVGSAVALFLSKNYIDPKKVHCIGHSLGAHVNLLFIFILSIYIICFQIRLVDL